MTMKTSKVSRFARWWMLGKHKSEHLVNVIKLSGVISPPSGSRPSPSRRTINFERTERWLEKAFGASFGLKPACVAVVVNSPGGSPSQSELIARRMRTMSRESGIPVVTFAEDVAASGGYWLLSAGDKAYACETSIVGSIGVISASLGVVDLAKKWGVERRVWTAGKAKLPMDPFLPVDEDQERRLRDVMENLHESFRDAVLEYRGDRLQGMDDPEKKEDIFSGRVWTGRQAVKVGLVDGVGTMPEVMKDMFGDKVRFRLCSEALQPGLRDIIGLQKTRFGPFLSAEDGQMDSQVYAASRSAILGAVDELDEHALWARFRV